MWIEGIQERLNLPDTNKQFAELRGVLSEEEAQKWLVKYLRCNIGLAAKWLLGIDLLPFQEILIKGLFQRDYSMLIISRGGSKSFSVAVFCALYAIFEQGTSIVLLSKTFRQSRLILSTIEQFAADPKAVLFKECMGNPSHKNDEWTLKIGLSKITALPLGTGEKLRGFRFKCMIIDEFLLMPEKIVNEVLMPFLSTNANPQERIRINKIENALVKQGKLKESERTKFKNSKMICMSSASYKFEFLYKKYCDYINNITRGYQIDKETEAKKPLDGSYFVFQLAYASLPDKLYDVSVLEASKKSMSPAQFGREYGSQFTDDSAGYFSAKALLECSAPEGSGDVIEVTGNPNCEYVMTCDPNGSESAEADMFAMSVAKVLPSGKYQIVHNYAVAGGTFKQHVAYFYYILTNFNIKLILLDNAGGQTFMGAANESKLFRDAGLRVDIVSAAEIKLNKTDPEVLKEHIKEFKKVYSKTHKAYCIYFDSDWIRVANELLQKNIDSRRIQFSCSLASNSNEYNSATERLENNSSLDDIGGFTADSVSDKPIIDGEEDEFFDEDLVEVSKKGAPAKKSKDRKQKTIDFIERQDELMVLTKKQISFIEPKQSTSGVISFDLSPSMKNTRGENRVRRDLYTAIFILTWAVHIWNEMGITDITDDGWGDYDGPIGFSGS